jgi:hypothetical protein
MTAFGGTAGIFAVMATIATVSKRLHRHGQRVRRFQDLRGYR